jgi:predicted lipid-binding transport protein (Tim44 family)
MSASSVEQPTQQEGTAMNLASVILVGVLTVASLDASAGSAARVGGGKSVGQQSANVSQRESAPVPAAAPGGAQNAQAGAPARTGTPAAPTPQAQSPWGTLVAGLAAGLGLAWLASALGLGPEFAQFLLFGLLALVIMVVVGLIMRRRPAEAAASVPPTEPHAATAPYAAPPRAAPPRAAPPRAAPAARGPMAYQGAAADVATSPRQYSPDKVGNDASARPWERSSMAFDAGKYAGGATLGAGLSSSRGWAVPAGFDTEAFIEAAKHNFLTLQEAWDRSDMATLRAMMTDEMLAEIRTQLNEREKHLHGQPNQTDVDILEAQMLGIEDLGNDYMASVEFSGMIREQPSAGPSPFREVWNMTKPKSGDSGWLVAGVQALQ